MLLFGSLIQVTQIKATIMHHVDIIGIQTNETL